ncbi:MAG: prepilin-type N-terminal cleavage/methylation domain-containing protein [Desulfobacteraceae bacterium]|nr:prepilin-type N-terminal cleavage/methylation domain-containing protein [Desulfobacteraceae bacterium]
MKYRRRPPPPVSTKSLATLTASGFTLIEVISVLLLIGILTVIAIGREANSGNQADVYGATEVLKNHLRYAQSTAMNSDVSWGLNFSGSSYTMQNASASTAPLPGDIPTGISYTPSVNPVLFDNRWGSPGAVTITITVSKGGFSQTVTVTKNTGFIP